MNSKITQPNTSINNGVTYATNTINQNPTPNHSTLGFEKGQLLHGEVTDYKPFDINFTDKQSSYQDSVSVRLDDGREITGRLETSVPLSIGSRVSFRVEYADSKTLSLKIIPGSISSVQDNPVEKALDAAGFPKNQKNCEIVKELLNQNMSIDKNTLSSIIKQSILYKENSISTLILLNKYDIPVNEANIRQMEAYQKMNHSIMNELTNLTDLVTHLFTPSEDLTFDEFFAQSKDLFSLLLEGKIENSSGMLGEPSIWQEPTDINPENVTVGALLSKEERIHLVNDIQTYSNLYPSFSKDLLNTIIEGTTDARELGTIIKSSMNSYEALKHMDTINLVEVPKALEDDSNGLHRLSSINTFLLAYEDMQYNKNEIGSFLNSDKRTHLVNLLDSYNLPEDIKDNILSGDIMNHELLKVIHSKLDTVSKDVIKNLFHSNEFKTLLKEEMLHQWTLNPEDLTKENEVWEYFHRLSAKLNQMKDYVEQHNNSKGENISNQTSQLNENINFMKTLNELFSYIQLPLKLKNQHAHGELYVYSKIKNKTIDDGISLLLHLDMNHLGPMDIFIDLHSKNLLSKFYLCDQAIPLVTEHIETLKSSLSRKGYQVKTEITKRLKEVNIVEDFMKQEEATTLMKRYNFDIKA